MPPQVDAVAEGGIVRETARGDQFAGDGHLGTAPRRGGPAHAQLHVEPQPRHEHEDSAGRRHAVLLPAPVLVPAWPAGRGPATVVVHLQHSGGDLRRRGTGRIVTRPAGSSRQTETHLTSHSHHPGSLAAPIWRSSDPLARRRARRRCRPAARTGRPVVVRRARNRCRNRSGIRVVTVLEAVVSHNRVVERVEKSTVNPSATVRAVDAAAR